METPTLPTLLSLLAAFGLALIAGRMKMALVVAPNAGRTPRGPEALFWRAVSWIANLFLFLSLVRVLLSSEPLTREAVAVMIFAALGLYHAFAIWWTRQTLESILGLRAGK